MPISLPSYLFKRNQIWYFRQRIPTHMIDHVGKTELKLSLKTRDLHIAKQQSWRLASRLWRYYVKHQSTQMTNKPDDFIELINIKDVKVGNIELGEIAIDHQGDVEAEQATLNAFLSVINKSKQSVPDEQTVHVATQPNAQSPKLSQAIGEYIANKRDEVDNNSKADEKTIGATEGKLNRLVQVLGDVTVNSVMRKDAERFRNTLLKLPSNINKKPEYKGLSLAEIINLSPTKTLSTATIRSYTEVASTFYKWCGLNQYSSFNPFESLKVKKPKNAKKDNEEREPWDPEQLLTMFSTDVFTKHKHLHAYYYWLPLIGLFSGARMNEICQLYLSEIVRIEDNLFFHITEELEGQKLKTSNSKRLVPVHSKLIKLGFVDYLNANKKNGAERLFPALTNLRDGYSKNASSWFARYRKKHELNIVDRKQDFHSFRHNVSDYFKQNDVPETQAAAIFGHANQKITYGRYGKDLKADKLISLIEKLEFEEVLINVVPWKINKNLRPR
jgi:integrase